MAARASKERPNMTLVPPTRTKKSKGNHGNRDVHVGTQHFLFGDYFCINIAVEAANCKLTA